MIRKRANDFITAQNIQHKEIFKSNNKSKIEKARIEEQMSQLKILAKKEEKMKIQNLNTKLTKILDDAKAKEREEAIALKRERNEFEDTEEDLEEERDKFVSGMTIMD